MRLRFVLIAALAVAACGGKSPSSGGGTAPTVPTTKPLYDRIGGRDAIRAIVADFVGNVGADPRINKFFAAANLDDLKAKLTDQICEATGGPCKYTGKSMKESHTGMGVNDEHFNALVEDLVKSLDKFGVTEPEKTELLTMLSKMKPEIVQP